MSCQPDIYSIGRIQQNVAPEKSEQTVKRNSDADPDNQHVKRAVAFMDQYLVNDQLKEYRSC